MQDGEKFLNSLTQGDGAIAPSLNRRGKGDKPGSTMLVFGSGSASQGETSIDASAFGISTKAGFFEFWQAIGLFISKPLTESNFKTTLEEMSINKLKDWSKENLSPNLVSMRTQVLQKVG